MGTGIHAHRHRDVVDFLGTEHLRRLHLPGVQNLPAQRHHGLELAVPGALRRTASGIAFHQKEFAVRRVLVGAVGQLAGERRAAQHLLAHHLLRRLRPALGVGDGHFGEAVAIRGMLAQPKAEGVLGDARNEGRGLPRRQAFFRLAAELGFGQLRREHVGALLPDVVAGDFHALRQQVAELAVLAQRFDEAAAQAGDVGAAERRGNEVDVAFGHYRAAFRQPLQRPLHALAVAFRLVVERRCRQPFFRVQRLAQVAAEPGLEAPVFALVRVRRFLDGQRHREAGAEHGLGAQQMAQPRSRDLRRVEVGGVRQKVDGRAGVAPAHRIHLLQRASGHAGLETLTMDAAVLLHLHHEPLGERVHHGHADSVQAAREAVALVVELAAGVQLGEDEFDAGEPVFGVDVHGHAAPVVHHFDGTVVVERDVDVGAEAVQHFVDAVVHDFLNEMVGAAGVRVHARPTAHRIEAGQHLDGFGGIGFAHRRSRSLRSMVSW